MESLFAAMPPFAPPVRGRYEQGENPSLPGLAPEYIYLSHSHEDHISGLSSERRVWQAVPVSSSFRASGHG